MLVLRQLLLLFGIVLLVRTQDFVGGRITQENEENVQAILKFLNENPKNRYIYKEGRYVNSQIKSDILQLTADVDVTCKVYHPQVPCIETTLCCTGFLRRNIDNQFTVLSASCKPKEEQSIEEPEIVPTNTVQQQQRPTEIDLSHEQTFSEQAPDFVAIKSTDGPCLGCPFDLNLNADGALDLVETALRHVETEHNEKHTAVRVIRLQEQIVSGVKYILLVEIAPTICPKTSTSKDCPIDQNKDTFICEIIYLQKPWLSSAKHIIKNNCTNSQEFLTIEDKPYKETAHSSKKEISDDFLAELESQIIPESSVVNQPVLRPYEVQNVPKVTETQEPIDQIVQLTPSYMLNEGKTENQVTDEGAKVPTAATETNKIPERYNPGDTENNESFQNAENLEQQVKVRYVRNVDSDEETEEDEESEERKKRNALRDVDDDDDDDDDDDNEKDYGSKRRIKRELKAISQKKSNNIYDNDDDDDSNSNSSESDENYKEKDKKGDDTKSSLNSDDNDAKELQSNKINQRSKKTNNADSDSSSSSEEDNSLNDKNDKEEIDSNDVDDSSDTSSDEDNSVAIKKQDKRNKKQKGNDDDDDDNDDSSNSTSNEDKEVEAKRQDEQNKNKKDKDDSDDDDDDSDSSSSSEEDDAKDKKNDKNSFSSLSSSSSEDKVHHFKVSKHKNSLNFRYSDEENDVKVEVQRKKRSIDDSATHRKKRAVGHLNNLSEEDKLEVKKLSKIAAKELRASKSKIEILDAEKVKIDGIYYMLKLHFDKQVCSVTMHINDYDEVNTVKKDCVKDDKVKYNRTRRHAVRVNADGAQTYRNIPGGIVPIEPNEELKNFLNEGLLQLDATSSHPYRYKIKEILTSSSQVVAGQLYRVKAKIIVTDCEKGSETNLEDCREIEEQPPRTCNFKIWNRPWIPNGRQTNITCEDNGQVLSFKSKRSISDSDESSQWQDLDDAYHAEKDFFDSFMSIYNKTYLNKVEYNFRFKVFKDNLKTIRLLNKFEQGSAIYGITKFVDMTKNEFSKTHGLRTDLRNENELSFVQAKIPNIDLPTEFDWRKKNAVTEVKDQGSCGSCWAFSTTGNIEGQYAIKYQKLLELSEQELVDCDKMDDGCNGGLMDNAYRYIEKIGGLETEQDYPYEAEDEKCNFNSSKVRVKLASAVNISHDETEMAKWLVAHGPISIAINANAMQFYVGGVSHPWKMLCNPKNLDHGVLIVGYGVHTYARFNKTLPYWIVKNSWGKDWGEQGYYRVYRGDGTCGLNQTPSSGIVA